MTICRDNISGRYMGEPWNWPGATNCQLLFEQLEKRGVAGEELNFAATGASGGGSINSVGEFVAAMTPQNISALVDQALARGDEIMQAERTVEVEAISRFRVGGVGQIERSTISPMTLLGNFRGQDLRIMEEAFRNLPAPIAEALLVRLRDADRDGQLGIIDRDRFLTGSV
jgi:hypothetical protein